MITGIIGTHVVAVVVSSGAVIASALSRWSCRAPRPVQFDGTWVIGPLLGSVECARDTAGIPRAIPAGHPLKGASCHR
jgi:hypothetical protein